MPRKLAITALITLLSACSGFEFPGAYKLVIDQGNIITGEMVEQLQVGMSRSQVEYILGTPLIRDTFSPNRWDYIYTLDERQGDIERNQLSVFFDNDTVSRYETNIDPKKPENTNTAPEELLDEVHKAAKEAEKKNRE